ncbi:MAG: hypothetical protein Q8Q12_07740 [bacterium]|nr:hypothetical protein [bacterium]
MPLAVTLHQVESVCVAGALIVSIVSLYFSTRHGPVRAWLAGDEEQVYPPGVTFNLQLVFYNGRRTETAVSYRISLGPEGGLDHVEDLARARTVVVAPWGYRVVSIECHTANPLHEVRQCVRVSWCFMKGGRRRGPLALQTRIAVRPRCMEGGANESDR